MVRVHLLLACLALTGCKSAPTSVLLRIEAEVGIPAPDELRLSVYSQQGAEVSDRRLPESGAPDLPGEVVLFPEQESGVLRVVVHARRGADVVGQGWTSVELTVGEQVQATVVLLSDTLLDSDGDGVPDVVDNCPFVPNPDQKPCTNDAGVDGPADAGPDHLILDGASDHGLDQSWDTRPDLPPGDTYPPCTCPLGCDPGTTNCRKLVPSGGFTTKDHLKLPPLSTVFPFDTTLCIGPGVTGAIVTSGGVKACVVGLDSLEITSAGKVVAVGDHPLVLVVKKDIVIDGAVEVGAKGTTPGPGGDKGGVTPVGGPGGVGGGPGGGKVCVCTIADGDDCGGGGGGFGSVGGVGGFEKAACTSKSTGGVSHGSATLVPLTGGSGGAGGGQESVLAGGAGGAGGGALQISSLQGTLVIKGTISAGGGGGGVVPPGVGSPHSVPGGGGGSGGAILLEAASISGSGLVAANGGGGGAAGTEACGIGSTGEDGAATQTPAKGGQAGTGASCGAGGDGATGSTPAGDGVDNPAAPSTGGGGGGGGGLGRIRLNWYNHGSNAPVLVSGVTSLGEVAVK